MWNMVTGAAKHTSSAALSDLVSYDEEATRSDAVAGKMARQEKWRAKWFYDLDLICLGDLAQHASSKSDFVVLIRQEI